MKATILVSIIVLAIVMKVVVGTAWEGVPDTYRIGPLRDSAQSGTEVDYWAEGTFTRYNEETWEEEQWEGYVSSQWHANGNRLGDDIACFFQARSGWNSVSGEGIGFPEDNYKQDQFTGQ